MLQAFIIVLREGVEAFLIVAITFAYLRKTQQSQLIRAVWWGIGGSVIVSALLGYGLWLTQGVNQPLWEGMLGLLTVVLVGSLVIHMWRTGPRLKQEMETKLQTATLQPTSQAALWGVFLFTILMISREGMETVLLLFQVHTPQIVTGIALGIGAGALFAYLWQQFSYLINMKHFFQVTAVYLLLFIAQVAMYSFHEFTEAGILPNSEVLHTATEPFTPEGYYGQWFSMLMIAGCALWLVGAWIQDRFLQSQPATATVGK